MKKRDTTPRIGVVEKGLIGRPIDNFESILKILHLDSSPFPMVLVKRDIPQALFNNSGSFKTSLLAVGVGPRSRVHFFRDGLKNLQHFEYSGRE